jgi:hypothetical protein
MELIKIKVDDIELKFNEMVSKIESIRSGIYEQRERLQRKWIYSAVVMLNRKWYRLNKASRGYIIRNYKQGNVYGTINVKILLWNAKDILAIINENCDKTLGLYRILKKTKEYNVCEIYISIDVIRALDDVNKIISNCERKMGCEAKERMKYKQVKALFDSNYYSWKENG